MARWIFAAFAAAAFLAVSQPVMADETIYTTISSGFLTGSDFRKMSIDQQNAYAVGVVEGIYISPLFGASDSAAGPRTVTGLQDCIKGMTGAQLGAIFRKYHENHPEEWHEPMNLTAYSALNNACWNRG